MMTGQALMDEALAQNRGVILAARHHGCWELCSLYNATRYSITSLYRPPRMKYLGAVMRAGREHTGARLAGKRRTSVIFIYAQRLRGGAGYHIHFQSTTTEVYDPDPTVAATAVNLGVENIVWECPEQYAWSYKRFNNRPFGEPRFY
jgi:Kdo2-lipid IVA lauroyltransferase/acyltransferase